jgi:hypothetical protein
MTEQPVAVITQHETAVSTDAVDLYFNPDTFKQLLAVGNLMAKSSLVPKHLAGHPEDCFLIAAQAFRWRLDPFAVAQHTFVVSGKLGYEGKLIAAIINSRIGSPLDYIYEGTGDGRKVTVTGCLPGSDTKRSVTGTVGDWKTANENWKKDPDQMLGYRGARTWARRYAPEVALGLVAEDEIPPTPMVDVTPPPKSAPAALDAFAGTKVPHMSIPVEGLKPEPEQKAQAQNVIEQSQNATEPEQLFGYTLSADGTVSDAESGEVVDLPVPPDEVRADYVERKRWAPFYKWLILTVPNLTDEHAHALYLRDRAVVTTICDYGASHKAAMLKLFSAKGLNL